jgi:hypothetical protein
VLFELAVNVISHDVQVDAVLGVEIVHVSLCAAAVA